VAARRIFVALVSFALLSACSSATPPAATVDGIGISNERVASDVALFTAVTAIAQQACGEPDPGESQQSACARAMLSNLIQEKVLSEYADAHDIRTDAGDVSQAVNSLKAQVGGAQVLDKALADGHVPVEAFRNLARRVVLFGNVQTAVAADLVTADDVRANYEDNAGQYTSVHAEHILVSTQREADDVYAKVTRPEATEQDFLDLAKQVSIDTSAKKNSGDLGPIAATDLDPDFLQAALALKPGEISSPVQTQFGWHVIRLVESSVTPFASVRGTIEQQLSQQAFTDWFSRQLRAATVEVNPRYGRWDVSLPAVVRITSTATGSASAAPETGAPSPVAS
jgi:parvulin-like peptidyl-prolyl isomerase